MTSNRARIAAYLLGITNIEDWADIKKLPLQNYIVVNNKIKIIESFTIFGQNVCHNVSYYLLNRMLYTHEGIEISYENKKMDTYIDACKVE